MECVIPIVSGHNYCHYANNCVYSRNYDDFVANLSSCGTWAGITETDISKELTIFPNPAAQTISVDCEKYRPADFRVFDVSGRTQTVSFKKQDNLFSANISELSKGMYFVQIQFDTGEVAMKKFVKE